MKFFKMNVGLTSIKLPLFRILISVIVLLLCFYRNRIIPQDNDVLVNIGTIVTYALTALGLYCIFISITEFMEMKKKSSIQTKTFEKREWSLDKLFSFMEDADIIDILIENANSSLKIGTKSDYGRAMPFSFEDQFFDKCYYIEDSEYENFDDFKKQFRAIVQSEVVVLLYVGIDDTPLDKL